MGGADRWEMIAVIDDPRVSEKPLPVVVPPAPRTVPPLLRVGLERRRAVVTTGRCPCGAALRPLAGRIDYFDTADHAGDCPAALREVVGYLRTLAPPEPPDGWRWADE